MSQFPLTPIGQLTRRAATWDPRKDADGQAITYLDLSSVDNVAKQIIAGHSIPAAEAPTRARQLVCTGDVLVATVRPNLNAVAQVAEGLDGATASTGFCVLRPADLLDARYLFHWVRTPSFVETMMRRATGANYPAISDRIVLESQIPLPAVQEQRRIADILDRADALRAKRREALALLDDLQQSIFLDMFRGLNTSDVRWPLEPIRALGRVRIGPFGSLLHQQDYVSDGVPIVNPTHIVNGSIRPAAKQSVSSSKAAQLSAYRLAAGDVVMGRRGEMGRCAVVWPTESGFLCGTGSLLVRPDPARLHPVYLQAALSAAETRRRLERAALGTTMLNLNQTIVEDFQIPSPPVVLQADYASRVAVTDGMRDAQLDDELVLSGLWTSLQERAFSGRL